MSNKFDIAHPLAIISLAVGAVVSIVLTLSIPTWLTLTAFLWLFWSIIALLSMADTPRRDFVEGTLRHRKFTQIYSAPTKWIVDYFWTRYGDEAYQGNNPIQIFRHALTWKLYDGALLIAAVYPIFLLTLIWIITGNDGRLGNAIVLPAAEFWPDRAATFGAIAILIAGMIARKLAAASRHRVMRQAADWLPILAGAGAVAVAVAFAVAWLDTRGKSQATRWFVTLILPIGWVALLVTMPWAEISPERRGVFLFLGVLPLINALFDVVSYAATLTLLRLGLRARLPLLNGLIDLAIAMILFLGLGACLTALITAMNALAQTTIFDLTGLFKGIREEPSDYHWLYLMMSCCPPPPMGPSRCSVCKASPRVSSAVMLQI